MKRFWLVMLSLGLVLAFSTSAMAVDVKVSGSFYAAGMYLDKTSLQKDVGPSTAFYYQRLRVGTEFIVSPGLKLVTRFDAMERAWGAARSIPDTARDSISEGTRAENENIAFDRAYVEYASPIGTFQVGYIPNSGWGTKFGNEFDQQGGISYYNAIGKVWFGAAVTKASENSRTAINPTVNYTDGDNDQYYAYVGYSEKNWTVAVLYDFLNFASTRPASNYKSTVHYVIPFFTANIGPFAVEGEFYYIFGKQVKMDSGAGDVDISEFNAYLSAVGTFGPVYVGGTFAYVMGDDPTTDKAEGGWANGGSAFDPCLIMFNYDRNYWAGTIPGFPGDAATSNASPMSNAWFGQGKIGVRPIAPLDIMASLSYAQADKKPLGVLNDLYGWEIDVTGTYKLTNNLSYMLGVGYLFTGDYYKGNSNANSVNNNYILINKLTLTF